MCPALIQALTSFCLLLLNRKCHSYQPTKRDLHWRGICWVHIRTVSEGSKKTTAFYPQKRDKCFTPLQTPYNFFLKLYKNKNIKVIGNPISIQKDPSKIVRENVILSVGRLIDSKHYDRLIRIFSEMDTGNWKLIILGGDALKEKNLQKRVDAFYIGPD